MQTKDTQKIAPTTFTETATELKSAVTNQQNQKTTTDSYSRNGRKKTTQKYGTQNHTHDLGDHRSENLMHAFILQEKETGRHIQMGIDSFWRLHSSHNRFLY